MRKATAANQPLLNQTVPVTIADANRKGKSTDFAAPRSPNIKDRCYGTCG
jgi:hypothetical protein